MGCTMGLARRQKPQRETTGPRTVTEIAEYCGCLITVRGSVMADGYFHGSYAIIAMSKETACQGLVFGSISSGTLEAPDAIYLIEMAKCTIDFLLEEPY